MIPSNIDYRFIDGLNLEADINKLIEHAKSNASKNDGATRDNVDGGKHMIIISEKPTIIGKLIHLNPQFYQSPGKITEALDKEQPLESKSHSKLHKPKDCPVGTVAILHSIGNGTYYVMKQDDGRWRRLTEPFDFFSEGLPMAALSATHFTLTILYNPDNDKSQSHEEPSAMYLIQIPTPPLRVLASRPMADLPVHSIARLRQR